MKAKKYVNKNYLEIDYLTPDKFYEVVKTIKNNFFVSGVGYLILNNNGELKGYDAKFFEQK